MDFKESDFYKNGYIFINEQTKYDRSGIFALPNTIVERRFHVNLQTGAVQSMTIFDKTSQSTITKKQKDFKLIQFGIPVIRKAIAKLEFYRFNNLKSFLPNVTSISEFITSDQYLGKIKLEVEGPEEKINSLTNEDKLNITVQILETISKTLQSDKVEYQGTEEFKPYQISEVFKNKTLSISVNESGDQEYGLPQSQTSNQALRIDLSQKDWYAFTDNFGTSEEKYLVKFIDKTYEILKEQYSEIYLVRNEKHFQLYNFDDGKPIEPDFVLFLKKKDADITLHYQVFIEPKGSHLLEHDAWKETFLKSLKQRHKINVLWKTKKYIIWGMPFYNESQRKNDFENTFNELIN